MDTILTLLNKEHLKIHDVAEALAEKGLDSRIAIIIIFIALEKCEMNEAERIGLLRVQDIILERLITLDGKYKVVPYLDDNAYDSGYFVSNLKYLSQPYTIHEHFYIQNGDTRLTEWYYTGSNGLKYRQVILPEEYKNPGFLLDNSIIKDREENMAKLAKEIKMR